MVFKPQTFHGVEPHGEVVHSAPAQIETAVADSLAASDGVDATDISVISSRGEIFLRGNVAFPAEIDRAVEVALSVPGVGKVTVDLAVGNPGTGRG